MVRHDIRNDPTKELHARFARVTTVESMYMCMQDKLEGEGATSYGLGYTRGRVRARKFLAASVLLVCMIRLGFLPSSDGSPRGSSEVKSARAKKRSSVRSEVEVKSTAQTCTRRK
jgi:hypothetical protein